MSLVEIVSHAFQYYRIVSRSSMKYMTKWTKLLTVNTGN